MKSQYNLSNLFNIKSIGHLFVMMIVAFSLVTFVGCGSDNSTSVNENPSNNNDNENEEPVDNQGANEVWMEGNTFNVANLEVEAGTTVTWTNNSNVNHTVTSGERGNDQAGSLFNSGSIAPGGVFSHTFEEAGAYPYFCEFHPGMDAEVTVTGE